jgi:hypothetical protein
MQLLNENNKVIMSVKVKPFTSAEIIDFVASVQELNEHPDHPERVKLFHRHQERVYSAEPVDAQKIADFGALQSYLSSSDSVYLATDGHIYTQTNDGVLSSLINQLVRWIWEKTFPSEKERLEAWALAAKQSLDAALSSRDLSNKALAPQIHAYRQAAERCWFGTGPHASDLLRTLTAYDHERTADCPLGIHPSYQKFLSHEKTQERISVILHSDLSIDERCTRLEDEVAWIQRVIELTPKPSRAFLREGRNPLGAIRMTIEADCPEDLRPFTYRALANCIKVQEQISAAIEKTPEPMPAPAAIHLPEPKREEIPPHPAFPVGEEIPDGKLPNRVYATLLKNPTPSLFATLLGTPAPSRVKIIDADFVKRAVQEKNFQRLRLIVAGIKQFTAEQADESLEIYSQYLTGMADQLEREAGRKARVAAELRDIEKHFAPRPLPPIETAQERNARLVALFPDVYSLGADGSLVFRRVGSEFPPPRITVSTVSVAVREAPERPSLDAAPVIADRLPAEKLTDVSAPLTPVKEVDDEPAESTDDETDSSLSSPAVEMTSQSVAPPQDAIITPPPVVTEPAHEPGRLARMREKLAHGIQAIEEHLHRPSLNEPASPAVPAEPSRVKARLGAAVTDIRHRLHIKTDAERRAELQQSLRSDPRAFTVQMFRNVSVEEGIEMIKGFVVEIRASLKADSSPANLEKQKAQLMAFFRGIQAAAEEKRASAKASRFRKTTLMAQAEKLDGYLDNVNKDLRAIDAQIRTAELPVR